MMRTGRHGGCYNVSPGDLIRGISGRYVELQLATLDNAGISRACGISLRIGRNSVLTLETDAGCLLVEVEHVLHDVDEHA